MQILVFLQSILYFVIFFFITFLYGNFFLHINQKIFGNLKINSLQFIKPILGLSTIILFSYYFYFNFNLPINEIIILFLISSLIILFYSFKKKNVFSEFYNILTFSLPIFIIFILIALIYGEQFYIFRGNYWDNMNYISSGLLVRDSVFSEIIELKELNINDEQALYHNGTKNIFVRPISNVLLAIFFYFKISNIFFTCFLFKVFLITQIFCSFYFLVSKFKIEKKYFLSVIFIFSFWVLYVFEIDAQSHLGSIAFFVSIIGVLIHKNNKLIFLNKSHANVFLLLCVSLFIFYPEIYTIFSLFFFIFIFLHINSINIIKYEWKNFLYLLFLFLFLTLPTYSTSYLGLLLQTKIAINPSIDYWGYYGLFLLGDAIELVSEENIKFVKNLFSDNQKFINFFPVMQNFFINEGYYLIPINILPSLAGLYYLTIGKIENNLDYLYLLITLLINIYIFSILKRNIRNIFSRTNKIKIIFLSFFLITIFLSLIFIINGNYWILIKLYFFVSPIIFLFLSLRIYKNNNKKFKLNIFFIILLSIFPFYKYSISNDGIGRLDSFPSIINPIYKKEINWNLDTKELIECNSVNFYSADRIIDGYMAIKLYDLGFKYNNKKNYKMNKNRLEDRKNHLCEVKLINSNFKIIKNEKY